MEFTEEMLEKLSTEEKTTLYMLYTKSAAPSRAVRRVMWTIPGPASNHSGEPSPPRTAGTTTAAALVKAALASSEGHA